jgi:hypothetical protein
VNSPVSSSPKPYALTFLVVLLLELVLSALACTESGTEIPIAAPDAGRDAGPEASRDQATPDRADAGHRPKDAARTPEASGPPLLVSLRVSSSEGSPDGSPPFALVPPFSPHVHDYYVRCVAGKNQLSVSMKASAGAASSVISPIVSGSSPEQTLSLAVKENQAVVAVATDGTASAEYWVRCLPHDFSQIEMVPHPDAGPVTPGYYLVGDEQPIPHQPNDRVSYAMVLDTNGVPVWYYRQDEAGVFDVDSVVQGTVSFIPWPAATGFSPMELHNLAEGTTTPIFGIGYAPDPHEVRALSNGHYLIFTDQVESGVDLTNYPGTTLDGGTFGPDASILPCDILEVDGTGDVAWQWIGTEHFDAVLDTVHPNALTVNDVNVADVFHCNSIDVEPGTGNLLVSARNMDSVFFIDKKTSAVLWKTGGSAYNKDGATIVPLKSPFHGQHDARLQPGWSTSCGGKGQFSVFDDETYSGAAARAVVYDVTVGGADAGAACGAAGADVSWEFEGSAESVFMGSFRILSDGTRIIGWGFGGAPSLVFTEVDVEKQRLLDFYFTDTDCSFRSIKVPLDQLDLGVMRSVTGLQ